MKKLLLILLCLPMIGFGQNKKELKRLIKSQAKTITERLTSFDDEVDNFFKGDCEIQPKDRIVYLRDKAKNFGLNTLPYSIRLILNNLQ